MSALGSGAFGTTTGACIAFAFAFATTARPKRRGRSRSFHEGTSQESLPSSAASPFARMGARGAARGKTPHNNCMNGISQRRGKQCANCVYAGSSESSTGNAGHANASNKCDLTSNVGPKPFFAKAGAHECRCKTPLMASRRAAMTYSLMRILARLGHHDLVQASPKGHLTPTKNVCIQRLQQARPPKRFHHWRDVIIAARTKRALTEVTLMRVQQ